MKLRIKRKQFWWTWRFCNQSKEKQMKLFNLYHVILENKKANWEAGFFISAESDDHLRIKVQSLSLVGNSEDWVLTDLFYICKTPDNVEEETYFG